MRCEPRPCTTIRLAKNRLPGAFPDDDANKGSKAYDSLGPGGAEK
jgi:hypothetical protein